MKMLNLLALFDALAVETGDDTPVLFYTVIGIVALLLVIAAIVLGKKTKKK